jgi:tetratricopeptide (TPR) repeat protein
MKKLFLLTCIFLGGVLLVNAQDKTAKEYKIEGAEAYKAKDFKKGLSSFEQAISLYEADGKTDTTLYFNAGICALKLEDYEKSIKMFDRSIGFEYKTCKSMLYKATSLKMLKRYTEMEEICTAGVTSCSENATDFNDLLFQYYLSSGLDIYNAAAKKQAEVTPLAKTDAEKYKAEMVKVKADMTNSLPMLEKANKINPANEDCKKALKQAYELLEMKDKAAALK